MTTKTWNTRLFGGRIIGITFDDVAGTLTILNQSISVSTLTLALQAEWAEAAVTTRGFGDGGSIAPATAPFGGSNVQRAVGNLLDAAPAWRCAVQAALALSAI
ncbi:hypothetical protein JOE51_007600 [Bradyrhizobium japonicum]|uniref:Uncharacterized protein n=1 Tax=Bradyrhizobium diazoefficiens TaxID=1355477 RepID=A0A810C6F4_9BRAD|nr:hypothetical protein [Bradyrhizobium japonicum]BCE30304.1 hypothetical protein XF2B_40730 [Bradyrhizobium diazoefficiens]BCE85022.1 hypothetical protein XF9B_64430 [Bradyrhizobium diazoefficiens]BCF00068.1 hypothetical protein XF11B_40880 [Bradyrhizobium diazoefficiens]BCF11121.1 hypothetical protein XF12B_64940 [Bradyrhizobium diazoefficiens]